jgi:hypothetical protein
MKYNKGDKVRVISDDGVYSTYLQWIYENRHEICDKLPHWVYNRDMDDSDLNDEWIVIHSAPHMDYSKDIIVFIDNGKKSFMINEDCLVSKEDSNYGVMDILKQLVSLIEENKCLLEKAKEMLESV